MSQFTSRTGEVLMAAAKIVKNGYWWELRTEARILGRSTSKSVVEGWQEQLAAKGFIDAESNV